MVCLREAVSTDVRKKVHGYLGNTRGDSEMKQYTEDSIFILVPLVP